MSPQFKRGYLIGLLIFTGVMILCAMGTGLVGGRRALEDGIVASIGIGFLSAMAFSAYSAFERPVLRWLSFMGTAAAVCMMLVLPVWALWETSTRHSFAGWGSTEWEWREFIQRFMGTGIYIAPVLCLSTAVLTARMKVVGTLVQWATVAMMAIACFLGVALVWNWRLFDDREEITVAAIVFAGAGVLTVFVLNKFFGIKLPDALSSVAANIWLRCPRCGKEQEVVAGEAQCAACKLRIRIEVEEPLCPKCGYNLHQLTRSVCPECGTRFGTDADPDLMKWAQANDAARA